MSNVWYALWVNIQSPDNELINMDSSVSDKNFK
jgi:hypothetical protein